MTNDAPRTLREIVARTIADTGFNCSPGSPVRTDSLVEAGPYHYMLADAAIAAVREHLLSDDVIDRSLARIPATSPMEMGALYRAAIGAALGDT